MNFQSILLSTVFIWNSIFAAEMPNDGLNQQTRQTQLSELRIDSQLTLMDGYDRYLSDPKFQLSAMRNA